MSERSRQAKSVAEDLQQLAASLEPVTKLDQESPTLTVECERALVVAWGRVRDGSGGLDSLDQNMIETLSANGESMVEHIFTEIAAPCVEGCSVTVEKLESLQGFTDVVLEIIEVLRNLI